MVNSLKNLALSPVPRNWITTLVSSHPIMCTFILSGSLFRLNSIVWQCWPYCEGSLRSSTRMSNSVSGEEYRSWRLWQRRYFVQKMYKLTVKPDIGYRHTEDNLRRIEAISRIDYPPFHIYINIFRFSIPVKSCSSASEIFAACEHWGKLSRIWMIRIATSVLNERLRTYR